MFWGSCGLWWEKIDRGCSAIGDDEDGGNMFGQFVCHHMGLVAMVCWGVSCYCRLSFRYPVCGIMGHGVDNDHGGVVWNVG